MIEKSADTDSSGEAVGASPSAAVPKQTARLLQIKADYPIGTGLFVSPHQEGLKGFHAVVVDYFQGYKVQEQHGNNFIVVVDLELNQRALRADNFRERVELVELPDDFRERALLQNYLRSRITGLASSLRRGQSLYREFGSVEIPPLGGANTVLIDALAERVLGLVNEPQEVRELPSDRIEQEILGFFQEQADAAASADVSKQVRRPTYSELQAAPTDDGFYRFSGSEPITVSGEEGESVVVVNTAYIAAQLSDQADLDVSITAAYNWASTLERFPFKCVMDCGTEGKITAPCATYYLTDVTRALEERPYAPLEHPVMNEYGWAWTENNDQLWTVPALERDWGVDRQPLNNFFTRAGLPKHKLCKAAARRQTLNAYALSEVEPFRALFSVSYGVELAVAADTITLITFDHGVDQLHPEQSGKQVFRQQLSESATVAPLTLDIFPATDFTIEPAELGTLWGIYQITWNETGERLYLQADSQRRLRAYTYSLQDTEPVYSLTSLEQAASEFRKNGTTQV